MATPIRLTITEEVKPNITHAEVESFDVALTEINVRYAKGYTTMETVIVTPAVLDEEGAILKPEVTKQVEKFNKLSTEHKILRDKAYDNFFIKCEIDTTKVATFFNELLNGE